MTPRVRSFVGLPWTGLLLARPGDCRLGLSGPGNKRSEPAEIGHPACHDQVLLWVVRAGNRTEIVEVRRDGRALDDAFMDDLVRGAFRGFAIDDVVWSEAVGRVAGLLLRSPRYAIMWPLYVLYRVLGGSASRRVRSGCPSRRRWCRCAR